MNNVLCTFYFTLLSIYIIKNLTFLLSNGNSSQASSFILYKYRLQLKFYFRVFFFYKNVKYLDIVDRQ